MLFKERGRKSASQTRGKNLEMIGGCYSSSLTERSEASSPRIPLRIRAIPLMVALAALVACLSSAPAALATTCNKFAASGVPSGIEGKNTNAGTEAAPYKTLAKLEESLTAGQTGCLESGQTFDTKENTYFGSSDGTEASPIVITATESAKPATITNALYVEASYLTFSHLIFKWKMPKPWVCWNTEGNPFECTGEPQNPEDSVQISVAAKHDTFLNDEVTNEDTDICINVVTGAEHTLIENDRIYECGPEFKGTKSVPNEESAWHDHGVYDYGKFTRIINNYIYGNSRNGILFYGSEAAEGGVAEHNIIDGNGNGITFGNDKKDTAQWNIITNSSLDDHGSKCEPKGCDDFATAAFDTEEKGGDSFEHNCTYNNLSGELEYALSEPLKPESKEMLYVTLKENKLETNPLYKNAATHEYTLSKSSPCIGYGPATAQPAPTAITEAATTVKGTEATLNGTVNPESLETKYSFQYGLTKSYGKETTPVSAGSGISNVKESKTITGLEAKTTYHFRIVATNNVDTTTYGEDLTFTTETVSPPGAAAVFTGKVGQTEVEVESSISAHGYDTHYYFQYGTTESYGSTQPAPPGADAGSAEGVPVSATLMGLTPGTTYHIRVAATNAGGTGYSKDSTFTTKAVRPPGVAAGIASKVGQTEAKMETWIDPYGWDTHYYFQYGTSESYGSTQPAPPGVDMGSSNESVGVNSTLTGLKPGTTYHFRAVATNAGGTSYGIDSTFKTEAVLAPGIAAPFALKVSPTEAELEAGVEPHGWDTHYYYEYGTSEAYGSTQPAPPGADVGSSTEDVWVFTTLAGLTPSTTYHYRIVATNAGGTTYSKDSTFKTEP
jgi:hypothetical protein